MTIFNYNDDRYFEMNAGKSPTCLHRITTKLLRFQASGSEYRVVHDTSHHSAHVDQSKVLQEVTVAFIMFVITVLVT